MREALTEEELQFLKEKYNFSFMNNSAEKTNENANRILSDFYKGFGIDISDKIAGHVNIDLVSDYRFLILLLFQYSVVDREKTVILTEARDKHLKRYICYSEDNKMELYANLHLFDLYEKILTDKISWKELNDFYALIRFHESLPSNIRSSSRSFDGDKLIEYIKKAHATGDLNIDLYYGKYALAKQEASMKYDDDLNMLKSIIIRCGKSLGLDQFDNLFDKDLTSTAIKEIEKSVSSKIIADNEKEFIKYFEPTEAHERACWAEPYTIGELAYDKCKDGEYHFISRISHMLDDLTNLLTKIHENNHAIEVGKLYEDEEVCVFLSGWQLEVGFKKKEEVNISSEDKKRIDDFRKYHRKNYSDRTILFLIDKFDKLCPRYSFFKDDNFQRLNEAINERITYDAYEMAYGEKPKTLVESDYISSFPLIEDFYQTFKADIVASRLDANIYHIINTVGYGNFIEFSKVIGSESADKRLLGKPDYASQAKKIVEDMKERYKESSRSM